MPIKIASDTFNDIGTSGPYNRPLDNLRGGTATLAHSNTAAPSLKGEGDGDLAWNNQTNSTAHVPYASLPVSGANLEFKPNGTTPSVFVSLLNGGSGGAIARVHLTGAYFINGTTLQIRTIKNDGVTIIRAAAAPLGAVVTAISLLSIEKSIDNLHWVAKLTDVGTGDVLATIEWTAASIAEVNGGSAPGQGMGYGFAGVASLPPRLSGIDLFAYTPPVLTGPTGSATGSTAAQGGVNTDIGNGTMYVATAVADLDRAAIIAANNTVAVTAAGLVTPPQSTGLTANTPGWKRQYLHIAAEGESAIVRSAAFNTPSLLAAPAGSAGTDVRGGTVVISYTPTGGPVASATASLPAHATPNGAVTEPPKPMTLSGGVWYAEFTPAPGDYGVPVVLASNSDNASVSITGAPAFSILDATGTALPGSDTLKPTLTLPTLISDQAGFITAGATTNEGNGTGYSVVTNSTTKPTPEQVKAGQIAGGGSAAPWARSVAVTATGIFTMRAAHSLTPGSWYAHTTQEDGAGNLADVVTSVALVLADSNRPVMSGTVSLTALTQTSYTTGCDAATDDVGVTGYRVSQDGGATWIDKGTSRTHNHTGRTPGSTDTVWWSARDAAGNWADPIMRSVPLSAVPAPVITTQPTSTSVIEGNGATLTAAATVSPGTLSWEWFTRPAGNTGSGTAVASSNAATLNTGNLVLGQNGVQFAADAINTIGGVTARTRTSWATVAVTALSSPPVMTGEITFSELTHQGFRATWPAVAGGGAVVYEVALNGSAWVSNSNLTTRYFSGTPSSVYELEVRAVNADGPSNVLEKQVTLPAAPPILPPGPGGKLVGMTPAALFHRLAVAAND